MKILAALMMCLGLQLFTCDLSQARGGPGKGSGIPEGGGSEPIPLGVAEKNDDLIRGTCNLTEAQKTADQKTEFTSPCVDVVIVLNDEDGNELARTRTTSKGGFKFAAEKAKAYRIDAASSHYELVSPTAAVHAGDTVQLQLKQK